MVIETKPREKSITEEPKFIDSEKLTREQMNDPDYWLKQLAKLNDGKLNITCSRCHHCR